LKLSAKIHRKFSNKYEFILFSYIFVLAAIVSLLLKAVKIRWIVAWLTPRKDGCWWKGKISDERISEYVDSILALGIWGVKSSCLNRSLLLYYFLHKIGVTVNINFGVRKIDHGIEGHGWLSLDGEPYLEKNEIWETFSPIYSYPNPPGN
jgi:hypothetical protein